jgi:hypothetical protein
MKAEAGKTTVDGAFLWFTSTRRHWLGMVGCRRNFNPPYRALFLVLILAWIGGEARAEDATTQPAGKATVIWISLDGVRGDDADKFDPPYFKQLMKTGAYSRELTPIFPSITFPNHTAQATGTTCDVHGIVNNAFRDTNLKVDFNFPNPQSLMKAEPIWTTASRQGVRTAVEEWPVSYGQTGEFAAAYFAAKGFDHDEPDRTRLFKLLEDWKKDSEQARGLVTPLRLFMGYVPSVDAAGHRYGPDAEETKAAYLGVDKMIQEFHEQAIARFKETAKPGDSLYLILSTDHGMSKVTELVNILEVLGKARDERVEILPSGPVANLYFDKIPEAERAGVIKSTLEALQDKEYLTAYAGSELPAKWGYDFPGRTGEIVVVLKNGCSFSFAIKTATESQEGKPVRGMHGYPVEENPQMLGLLIISRYPEPLGGKDLGAVSSLQLHPTVAKILGIEPSGMAKEKAIEVK